ncbi:hypothetical protein BSLA_02r2704 [Burkholderia stabilis]|nr:hypothetical protein BSLA_02r2704 [Burkholderia stabilis]
MTSLANQAGDDREIPEMAKSRIHISTGGRIQTVKRVSGGRIKPIQGDHLWLAARAKQCARPHPAYRKTE